MTKHMKKINEYWEKKLGPLILFSFCQYYGGYKRQVEGGIRSPASMGTIFLFKKHFLFISDVFDNENEWDLLIPFESIIIDDLENKTTGLDYDDYTNIVKNSSGVKLLEISFYDENNIFQKPKFGIHWSPFPKIVVGCASIFRGGGLAKFNQKFYDLLIEFKKSEKSTKTIEQSIDEKMILKSLKKDEGKTLDFKDQRFISDKFKIARSLVAFANNKFVSGKFGGHIIIGIQNKSKKILGVNFDPKHEEHIMNIARDKCIPTIEPIFKKVILNSKTVYLISIPKMNKVPYQLKTKDGNIHLIRVGSTIREPDPDELSRLYSD